MGKNGTTQPFIFMIVVLRMSVCGAGLLKGGLEDGVDVDAAFVFELRDGAVSDETVRHGEDDRASGGLRMALSEMFDDGFAEAPGADAVFDGHDAPESGRCHAVQHGGVQRFEET